MHSSISAHIANDYLLGPALGQWGPNLTLFEERLGNPAVKERVENMYFTYLFVLRAVQKAGPMLNRLDYDTGLPEEDRQTRELVHELVCPEPPQTLKAQYLEPYTRAPRRIIYNTTPR